MSATATVELRVSKSERLRGTNFRFKSILNAERRLPAIMALVFLPWIAVVLFTGGGWAALNFVGYAIAILASGYWIVSTVMPAHTRSEAVLLTPALGITVISALSAFWLRLGFPLIGVPILWLCLAGAGALSLWSDHSRLAKCTVAYGKTLVLFSALICTVYFVPGARNDAVLRHDGSFNWIYGDTQHFYAIAAAIKSSDGVPKTPGTATAELLYHFGPYASAAAISRLDGLDLGDALVRVTGAAWLWALVLSSFGAGRLLSHRANGTEFGGIMSIAGLFFYGSLLSLFTDERVSSSHVTGAIVVNIPWITVLADGGPFSHLVLGHSALHGLVTITAILGLCLAHMERETRLYWREFVLLALPALAVPVNSVAAVYCVAVAGILLFWGNIRVLRNWLHFFLMLGLFVAAWEIMGYVHATDASGMMMKRHLALQWWPITVWWAVGLGFRITGFRWISRPFKDPLSALVLVSAVGLLAFSLFLQLRDENERYGLYFLQSMFSLFAFSRLNPGCWRGIERAQWITDWLDLAKWGMILLSVSGALFGIVHVMNRSHTGIEDFRFKVFLSFLLAGLLAITSVLMKRNQRFRSAGSAVLMAVLMIGFLAWITPWINFGLGRMKMDITLSAGEVQGLHRLRELAAPGERFSTNKHAVEGFATRKERSYGYSALSEHPVLLEGYLDRGETTLPWFASLLHDNDLMFTTKDPEMLRTLAMNWHVRWLVARPGTDLSLPRPLPSWLVQEQNCGDLRIYHLN